MLQVLSSEFVRTARAAGLTSRTVILTYAFRNAMLPVVTTLGMVFSFLLGANVLVEKVFAWPGIGSYAVEALITSDFAPVQGFVLAMAILSAMTGNTEATDGFFYGGVVGICSGLALNTIYPKSVEPELRHAMAIAAIAYLVVPAISSIPFVVTEHMSPLDAFFEAISGWTGSGFSMIALPENSNTLIQLWRSHYPVGSEGMGVILLMVTILIRPGTSTYMLINPRPGKIRYYPSNPLDLNVIWSLYLVLTVISLLLLLAVGMPVWDALNTALSAISTGGFSIYGDSVAAYNSLPIEIMLLPIMIAGALPFAVVYKAVKKGALKLFKDTQVKAFLILIVLGVVILSIDNYYYYHDAATTIRYSAFQYISAITCAGFQSVDVSQWSQSALLLMSIAMVIGGCAGSTAGGIKVARAIFIWNEVKLWLARMMRSKNSVVAIK